jgi:alpha-glucosidase
LNGEVGKYITIARQRNDVWYLGSMTNWDQRYLEVPLGFLGPSEYEAQIFADGADAARIATSLDVTTKYVKAADNLPVHLAPGGGFAAMFSPVKR